MVTDSSHQKLTLKRGVILVNLGTPDKPTPAAVRHFLIEFLSDRRVVEIPPLLWQPLLRFIIAPLRSKKISKLYQAIWDKQANQSPLRHFTQNLGYKVQEKLPDISLRVAMRYGQPSIATAMQSLKDEDCDEIAILPLYPQYCAATVATSMEAFYRWVTTQRYYPSLRQIPPFYRHPRYLQAIALSLKQGLRQAEAEGKPKIDKLLISFHGMPERTRQLGDPYYQQVIASAELIRQAAGLEPDFIQIGFQSRFGPAQWLQPSSTDQITRLAEQGFQNIAVIAPGFFTDCLETLEEVAVGLRELFLAKGGKNFTYIPCLNDQDEATEVITSLIREHFGLGG